MNDTEARGLWQEERLYVLRTLEDLKCEQKRQAESTAADRVALLEKAARDIKAAHDKIRVLEGSGHSLKLKNWIMAAVLSGISVFLFELVKAWLAGWKP
jgi:hypothetical protein